MNSISLAELEQAAALIYRHVPPTPQYRWPLLAERTGCELWVKHENHTPVGAFKIRGALVILDALRREQPDAKGVICATRGNHGQGIALAARKLGLSCTVVVPQGNSREKNAAMRALGAELIEHGQDFQESLEYSQQLARERGLWPAPSFDRLLALGAATYGRELLLAVPDLDAIYVPIGLGSGISGTIAARDAMGAKARVLGVTSVGTAAYKLSFEQRRAVESAVSTRIADGMACRIPNAESLEVIWRGAERIAEVSDDEIEAAMRAYFTDAHQVVEGAGAASLAAVIKDRELLRGKKVAVVLSGGNVDREVYARVLSQTQRASAQ
jgi:threonine dehydratase